MTAFYNEFDPKAAAWLRELIRRGLIADGVVDERSILDVQPDDLKGFTQCHFFAGIGGWSLALRMAGWPDDRPVWTGSPPCQPFSAAGRQKGKDDERHLAPHFAALVAECRPAVLFGEQVASAAVFGKASSRAGASVEGQAPLEWAWLDDLFERLEAAHYACGASDIPAAGVGAAHIRQRTFFGAVGLADASGAAREWNAGSVSGAKAAQHGARLGIHGGMSVGHKHGGADGGLADADRSRHEGDGLRPVFGGRDRVGPLASPSGLRASGGLADADDAGSQGRPGVSERAGERLAGAGGVGGGLANPPHAGRPEWRPLAGNGSVAGGSGGLCGLADADGRDARAEGLQRGGQHGQQPQDGGAGGLADAEHAERWPVGQHGENGRDGPNSGREKAHGLAGTRSQVRGRPDATDLGWPSADWLFCRDGKWRPVEPGTFPLAHGVSARVGRLRGYGNAIVPQAAAEFIKAFDAAAAECFRLNDLSGMTTDNEGVFG